MSLAYAYYLKKASCNFVT